MMRYGHEILSEDVLRDIYPFSYGQPHHLGVRIGHEPQFGMTYAEHVYLYRCTYPHLYAYLKNHHIQSVQVYQYVL